MRRRQEINVHETQEYCIARIRSIAVTMDPQLIWRIELISRTSSIRSQTFLDRSTKTSLAR